jgi:phosphoglycerol geranylgeranyltransferase
VERSLRRRVEQGEKLVLVLVDPEKRVDPQAIKRMVDAGADAILVGGSLNVLPYDIDAQIKELREVGVNVPFIIFPGGLNNIARSADAILFMTLMNSLDPYWIMGAQIVAAPLIRKLGLEPIPTAYLIYGYGGAAGHVGRALPVPWQLPYMVAAYAMASEMLGTRLFYLEAGSGAPNPVPREAVEAARRSLEHSLLVVGGGIRSPDHARSVTEAGADAIVIGTIVEKDPKQAENIISQVKRR